LSADETEITLNAFKNRLNAKSNIALIQETNPGVTATSRDINNLKVK